MSSPWVGTAVGGPRHPLNEEEARRALLVFADSSPEMAVHFQAKPHWRTRLAPGADVEGMLEAIRELDSGDSIYFGLNPVLVSLKLAAGKDVLAADIQRRRWFFIDIDRVKTAADKHLSARKVEKDACRLVAKAVAEYLVHERGWPEPVVTDSGNGFGLFFRIDLPHDRIVQALLRQCLRNLAARFDCANVSIDKSTHNADRIAKLPGSWSAKGPDDADRPHRMCRLIYVPETLTVVSLESIQSLGCPTKGTTTTPAVAPLGPLVGRASSSSNPNAAYVRALLEGQCRTMALTAHGELNDQAYRSAARVGEAVGAGLLSEEEAFNAVYAALKQAGGDDPSKDQDTIRRGIEQGKTHPLQIPDKLALPDPAASASDKVPATECITYRASTVTPRRVDFLWPGRLPLGKLVTFAGQGGIGKTFVLCDITARITAGLEWPSSDGALAPVGQVLFLSAEDDPDDTLVPRLIECGADLNRVSFLKNAVQDYFTLADLKTLDRALGEMGDDVRFVVLDPPTSFLGGVDDHKNAELRALLSPLASWASRHRLCVIFNTHFNKSSGAGMDAAMRVMGSIAWTTAVRAAHAFARDPQDEERVFFIPMKMNLTRRRKGLAYRILPLDDERARVEWLGEVDTTANEAVNPGRPKKRRIAAAEWLAELFADTMELLSKTIFQRTKDETTVSADAIKEAKEDMGMNAKQKTGPDGTTAWFWIWPDTARARWEDRRRQHENGQGRN